MSNVAAFFDLDGTLYREGLITEIFKKMVKYEIIDTERWYNDVRPDYLKWDKRQGDYDDYLLKMTDIYIESIKGLEKSQMEYIAKKIVEQKGDRVYTFTRDRIKWHKDNNHTLIIISGSPSEMVAEMAKKYGFTKKEQFIFDKDVSLDKIDALIEIKKPILKFSHLKDQKIKIEQKNIRDYLSNIIE